VHSVFWSKCFGYQQSVCVIHTHAAPKSVWSSQLEKRTWKNTVYFRGLMGCEGGPASSSSPCDTDARTLYMWRHMDEANMDRRIVEMLDQSLKSLATLKDAIAR